MTGNLLAATDEEVLERIRKYQILFYGAEDKERNTPYDDADIFKSIEEGREIRRNIHKSIDKEVVIS